MLFFTLFTDLLIACSVFLFLKWIGGFRGKKLNLKLPPGPRGWPLIGNLPVLLESPRRTNEEYYFTRCARKYGDIYRLTFGPQMMYVLCKFDYVSEAFTHSYLQGRPPTVAYEACYGPEAKALIGSSGPAWKALKQFTAGVFRDVGVGKGLFETRIQTELDRFVAKLENELGRTYWGLTNLFYLATSNVTCGITFGRQFDYDDSKFIEIVGIMETFVKAIGPSAIVLGNRMLFGLPFGPGKTLRDCLFRFKDFVEFEIEDNVDAVSAERTSNNFLGAFLEEIQHGTEYFNKASLFACCFELFFAGTETTSNTLCFAILCLAANPEIQTEAQKELDTYVKENGMPSYSDRSKLPYLQGLILEVHRLLCVGPLGVAHVAERDLKLFDYDVPKGTLLAANMGSLFFNPNVFPEPRVFNPKRYLKDGRFEAIADVIPFSIGRRACLGEQLARMEIFLFLTNLLHRYTFMPPEGVELPSIHELHYGGTRIPPPFAVVISRRNQE